MAFDSKQKDIWEITQDKCVVAEVEMTIFGDVKLDVNGELVFESPEEVQEFCENLQILSDMLFAQIEEEDEDEDE
jgi:hypothetical protein